MRILMDFEYNKKNETVNSIRVTDIEEVLKISISQSWEANSKNEFPDDLCIELQTYQDEEFWIRGWYNLDGTKETLNKALHNYNEVTNKLLEKGYCKISDFENVTWN